MLKASLELFGLTTDCPAILLTDYGREQGRVTLPVGTIFVVEADARSVAGHPDKVFNRIVSGGEHYLVEPTILADSSTKMRPEEEEPQRESEVPPSTIAVQGGNVTTDEDLRAEYERLKAQYEILRRKSRPITAEWFAAVSRDIIATSVRARYDIQVLTKALLLAGVLSADHITAAAEEVDRDRSQLSTADGLERFINEYCGWGLLKGSNQKPE